ncbi:MAG: transcription termination/antitermination protein NusG [Chloroflexota bacterium]
MREWYALRAKTKKELLAADLLARAGIEAYVPQVKVACTCGRPPQLQPFFPGYFFSKLDPELGEIRLANYTAGVLYVLNFGGQPWPVPDSLVVTIRERLAQSGGRLPLPYFRLGDRLVITTGPFAGADAIFDCCLSPTGRVRVLIEMLHRLCRVDLRVDQLRQVGKAAG